MGKEKDLFFVEHIYEKDNEEEVKFIGVFSSIKNAKSAVNILIEKPGFRDFPRSCFHITKGELDRYEWTDGFISWEEANEFND